MYTSNSSGDRVLTTKAREAGFTDQIAAKREEFATVQACILTSPSFKIAVKTLEGIAKYFKKNTEAQVVETQTGLETPAVQVVETQTGLETPAVQVVETQTGLETPAVQVVETQTDLLETPAVQVVETQTVLETETPDEPDFEHPPAYETTDEHQDFEHPFDSCFGFGGFTNLIPAVQVVETQTGLETPAVLVEQTVLETPDEPQDFEHPPAYFGFGGFTNLLLYCPLPNMHMSMGLTGAIFPDVPDDEEHNQNLALLISPQETGDLKSANFTTAALKKLKVSGLVQ
jgi:hypothetical protein